MVTNFFEKCLATHSVECVGKIQLDENLVCVACVSVEPLASGVQANFCAERLCNSNLQWPQKLLGLLFVRGAENFGRQARDAPASQGATLRGTSPFTITVTSVARCSRSSSRWTLLVASWRCAGRIPEGPAPECLLNELSACETLSTSTVGTKPLPAKPKWL
eukprot:10507924-Karenia_brevis.AAC.2